MMYEKCRYCVNSGRICQGIIAPAMITLRDLEYTTNRAFQYSRQITKDNPEPIKIEMHLNCLSFKQYKNDS